MLRVVLWLYNALYKYVIIIINNYLMKCPLYQSERYCLFRSLRETNKYIETLLFGNEDNEKIDYTSKTREDQNIYDK